jgi:hypothetical protein
MAHYQDWLPSNHDALYKQAIQTDDYLRLSSQRDRMGFVETSPQGKWLDDVFHPSLLDFETKYRAWTDTSTRTEAIITALATSQKTLTSNYRRLYTGFLKSNPLVTDEDLVRMGLPKRNTERTPVPVPTTWPESHVDTSTQRRIVIHFFDSTDPHKKSKPEGVHGAEIRWQVFDAQQVVTMENLIESSFDTKTPFTLDFKEEQRGKILYYALRWENTRGEKGPFSLIQNIIIP